MNTKQIKQTNAAFVLIAVVIMATLGGILAAALLYGTGSQVARTSREIRYEKAFFIAEAGVERAKAELRSGTGTLDNVLLGADSIGNTSDDGLPAFGATVNFGAGTYQVRIADDDDGDANPFADTNNTVIIRSTGTYENASRKLEVAVLVEPVNLPPPSVDGAVGVYGTNTQVSASGNALIDGQDYSVPTNFDANGAAVAGTLTTNPAVPGVFSTTTDTVITTSGAGSIIGNPPTTNSATSQFSTNYWQDLADALIPQAAITLSGSYSADTDLGTRTNPKITVVTGDTTISGNPDGAGVLILMNGVTLTTSGNFHYEGLLILTGNNIFGATGTVRLFGAMVSIGEGGNISTAQGTPAILYSSAALANLRNLQLNPRPLSVVYWREIR